MNQLYTLAVCRGLSTGGNTSRHGSNVPARHNHGIVEGGEKREEPRPLAVCLFGLFSPATLPSFLRSCTSHDSTWPPDWETNEASGKHCTALHRQFTVSSPSNSGDPKDSEDKGADPGGGWRKQGGVGSERGALPTVFQQHTMPALLLLLLFPRLARLAAGPRPKDARAGQGGCTLPPQPLPGSACNSRLPKGLRAGRLSLSPALAAAACQPMQPMTPA